jgi:tetratricopeptide (TPR) repeat protein
MKTLSTSVYQPLRSTDVEPAERAWQIAGRLWLGWLALFSMSAICGCNLGAQRQNAVGVEAYNSGQYPAAINEFQQAININPKDADAFYNLGATYYALGKQSKNQNYFQKAEQLYRQSIALNDQHTPAHRGLAAVLIETGQEKNAFDLINTWQQRYPNSADPTIELARLYQEYGDNRRATDLLADALRMDGQNVRALKAMGHIREVQGQTHLALDNYMRVLQIDSSQADVAAKVQTLQTQLASLPAGATSPTGPNTNGPSRYGSTNPYVTR